MKITRFDLKRKKKPFVEVGEFVTVNHKPMYNGHLMYVRNSFNDEYYCLIPVGLVSDVIIAHRDNVVKLGFKRESLNSLTENEKVMIKNYLIRKK